MCDISWRSLGSTGGGFLETWDYEDRWRKTNKQANKYPLQVWYYYIWWVMPRTVVFISSWSIGNCERFVIRWRKTGLIFCLRKQIILAAVWRQHRNEVQLPVRKRIQSWGLTLEHNNNRGSEPAKHNLRDTFQVELPKVFNLLLDISPFWQCLPILQRKIKIKQDFFYIDLFCILQREQYLPN